MPNESFEYATVEWLWDTGHLRVNRPGGQEDQQDGSYAELVELLTSLGGEGWQVASRANWIFWTLQRRR
jgi:hypothetical protein